MYRANSWKHPHLGSYYSKPCLCVVTKLFVWTRNSLCLDGNILFQIYQTYQVHEQTSQVLFYYNGFAHSVTWSTGFHKPACSNSKLSTFEQSSFKLIL